MIDLSGMNEARRFFRYVLPGGLFFTETFGLLAIVYPIEALHTFKEVASDSGLGAAVGGLIATGSMGFALSLVFHAMTPSVDFREAVNAAIRLGRLKVVDGKSDVVLADIDRDKAFVVITSAWHQLLKRSPRIEGAHERMNGLGDLAYSLGTVYVATWFAPLSAFAVGLHVPPSNTSVFVRSMFAATVALLALVVAGTNYRQARNTYARVASGAFLDGLTDEPKKDEPKKDPFQVSIFGESA